MSNVPRKANSDLDDDVILNIPGWQHKSWPLPSTVVPAGAVPKEAANVDNTLRLLLVMWNEELEQELRGLHFLLWHANPRAKAKLGAIIKLMLPLHHEELMKSPIEDFVVHWQAAVVPSASGQGIDDRIMESDDTDSW